MRKLMRNRKAMAWVVLLTFLFTSIVPTGTAFATDGQTQEQDLIQFKMFNYSENINKSNENWRAIAPYFSFRGIEGAAVYPNKVTVNGQEVSTGNMDYEYSEDGFTKKHATVERVLTDGDYDGYPILELTRYPDGSKRTNPPDLSADDRSLAYLFGGIDDDEVTAYTATNDLVRKASGNWYEYNSRNTKVDFTQIDKDWQFVLQDTPERTVDSLTVQNDLNCNKDDNPNNNVTLGDFLPFTVTDDMGTGIPKENVDYWYGMTMKTTFVQPEGGKLSNGTENMKFEFSGDDDVWVFIDGVLVLDLGGTHGIVTGSIDFSNGDIVQHIDWDDDNGSKKIFHWCTNVKKCTEVENGKKYADTFPQTLEVGQKAKKVNDLECQCGATTGYNKNYTTNLKQRFVDAGKVEETAWRDNTFADDSSHTIKMFYLERGSSCANCWIKFNLEPVETVNIPVTKEWRDENNQDGRRPDSVQVQLYDGENAVLGKTLTLSEENQWTATFANLPKHRTSGGNNGEEIVYTVKEVNVPEGYTATDGNKENSYVITNTYVPETIDISGIKTWVDEGNKAGKRPESITVSLHANTGTNGELVKVATQDVTTSSSWKYEFTGLNKYQNGKEINYVVTEDKVDHYQTFYDADSYDITNIYKDSPEMFMDLPVEKVWQDNDDKAGLRPKEIKLWLVRNNVVTTSAITITPKADGSWYHVYEDLPKYDDNGKAYVYTVVETPVDNYLSSVITRADKVTIYNKLYHGEVGTFNVNKTVTGDKAPANAEFDFELEVSAEMKDWDSLLVYNKQQLEKAAEEATAAVDAAQVEFDKAVDLFAQNASVYSTSSAYLFVMNVTTSQGYEYVMIDDSETVYSKTITSGSAYDFQSGAAEYTGDEKAGLLTTVINAVKEMAKTFSHMPNPATFVSELLKEAGSQQNASVQFEQTDAETLLSKAGLLFDAERTAEATSAAMLQFEQNVPTTPSAIKVIMTPKGKITGPEVVYELDTNSNYFDNGVYTIPFKLIHDGEYDFAIEATTGAAITYKVTETGYPTTDYEGKTVYEGTTVNGDEAWTTGLKELTKDTVHAAYAFINKYANNPTEEPWTPPYVPPTDPTDPPEVIDDPETPLADVPEEDVEIVEPGVPLADAPEEEEIFEEEIPLGDAPPTGDTNNAIPFVVLMMVAVAGMVVTRRKFN